MDDELRQELWVGARDVLKRNRFRLVIENRNGTSYWRRDRDRAYALLEPAPNGEPKVTRLDDDDRAR